MGNSISLPEVFTDPEEIIDCLLKGNQLSFTPDFIKKHSAISLQCANESRKRYPMIGGDCSWGFHNVFVKLMKEKIPSYVEDPAQLLALKYTGYYKYEYEIDEESGILKRDEEGKRIRKRDEEGKLIPPVLCWNMDMSNLPEVYYSLVTEKDKSIATMGEHLQAIHRRITDEKNGDRFYHSHSITNDEFGIFAGYLKEIKDGRHGKNIYLK